MSRILVVDDDQASARTLELHLGAEGHEAAVAHDAEQGLAVACDWHPDLIILDVRMPGRSGLDVLPELKALLPGSAVVVITAFHDMDTTIEAMQKGAEEYIHKPVDIDELDAAVARLLKPAGGGEEVLESLPPKGRFTMVGGSRAMKEVFKAIGLVARTALGRIGVAVPAGINHCNLALVLVVVWIALSRSHNTLQQAPRTVLIAGLLATSFHGLLLAVAALTARCLGLGPGRRETVWLLGAQKTLPVALLLQTALFPEYGDALVFCVVHHVLHLSADGILANHTSPLPKAR